MKPVTKTILKSFDKAYKIQAVSRIEIESFKTNYIKLIDRVEESESRNESEENFKGHLMDFLKNTYFQRNNLVAPKGKTDFVIHTTNEGSSPAAILFEVKRPKNTAEMVSRTNLNTKAMQELMLYYFEERSKHQNNDITHLVITNIHEWFIFESNTFERLFYKNSKLLKDFKDWKDGKKVSRTNDLFYNEIAKPALNAIDEAIEFTYFDIRTYEKNIRNTDLEDDKKLIELYKVFSPTHLLKLQAANDNNKLNSKFYSELLHIIGLEEVKDGGKKLIQRKANANRNEGSLLENCINILESEDRFHHVKDLFSYGKSNDEQNFNIGLELCITWINRILFLKLLEAQLQKYHSNNTPLSIGEGRGVRFLNSQTIRDFDVLNKLFFQVLAKPIENRSESIQAQFSRIPYLNSSLFDISPLEDDTIRINSLDDSLSLPLLSSSVLRKNASFSAKKQINTLDYLFAFLDAYDFSSENKEDIVEENRELISASVLGLIFEKINGYRDGSFYTPAFITEYMCKETITKAVIQKFNETKGWNCLTLTDLHNKIDDLKEANQIFDSLHICDPAVGSGHFLVSALNALIFIKAEIGILQDRNGKRLKGYTIEVINDELIVLDEEEKVFEYKVLPNGKINTEIQRVQETLFHQKQTLIENCLFGVDINPNSVKICRLRLWIELLKNAYYTNPTPALPNREGIVPPLLGEVRWGLELQTLPNIDINIKQGNSLLSKFALNEDLSDVFQKQKFSLATYRDAVQAYKDSKGKEAKAELLRFINEIKEQFRQTVSNRDVRRKKLSELRGKRILLDHNVDMFGNTKVDKDQAELQKRKLDTEITKIEAEIADIEQNNLYKGSFEWRFEFPEILDDKGDFVGFDAVIGNPPYMTKLEDPNLKQYLKNSYKTSQYQLDLYVAFMELGTKLLKNKGKISYITPNSWLKNMLFESCRKFILDNWSIETIIPNLNNVFSDASVDTCIFLSSIEKNNFQTNIYTVDKFEFQYKHSIDTNNFRNNERLVFDVESNDSVSALIVKIKNNSIMHHQICEITRGVNPYDKYRGQSEEIIKNKLYHSDFKKDDTFIPEIRGKHLSSYSYQWDGKSYISYGAWLAAPREPKFFTGERLVMRQVLAQKLICTIIEDDIVIDQSIFISKLLPNYELGFNLKYILALFASKLMIFYFRVSSNEFDALFPKIKIGEFRELPIKQISLNNQAPIIAKVEQILAAKRANPATDTSQLEAEIDAMVYELYDLTAEEIAIVEGR